MSVDDLDHAFWLTRSIGRTIGVNFSVAMDEGRIEPEGYAELIRICRACSRGAHCQKWLAEAGGPNGSSRAPDFCPNAKVMQTLKPH